MPRVSDSPLYVMQPVEVLCGYVFGYATPEPSDSGHTDADPRQVLEEIVRRALLRAPCGVAFSGGRDSSTVLAVATHVARRDGLPEPIPITRVFPGVPGAEELEWQELVIRHLGLDNWHRVELTDELDLIGELAAPRLLEHGVSWPPTGHGDIPLLEPLSPGGSLLDGEGGDVVLGVTAHRVAPVTTLLRSPRPLRWSRLRSAGGALAPTRIRASHITRGYHDKGFSWLRPEVEDALVRFLGSSAAAEPLSFAASVRMAPHTRSDTLWAHNRQFFADQRGVRFTSPLLDPRFVEALARDGGWLGRGDRAAVLRRLVPDLLPDAILTRTSKASFGGAFLARPTREFAARWTGEGLDANLVDPDELRRIWQRGEGSFLVAALLQTAWLATEGAALRSSRAATIVRTYLKRTNLTLGERSARHPGCAERGSVQYSRHAAGGNHRGCGAVEVAHRWGDVEQFAKETARADNSSREVTR